MKDAHCKPNLPERSLRLSRVGTCRQLVLTVHEASAIEHDVLEPPDSLRGCKNKTVKLLVFTGWEGNGKFSVPSCSHQCKAALPRYSTGRVFDASGGSARSR